MKNYHLNLIKDSQPNKYNMMMQLPPDNSTPSLQTSKTKKDSQKLFKKLPAGIIFSYIVSIYTP